MPIQSQIMPTHLQPHVVTYINDNTLFVDEVVTAEENGLRIIAGFASKKGRDRKLIKYNNVKDYIERNGEPDFTKYGLPGYIPYLALSTGNAIVYGERIMPDDASYANIVICAEFKEQGGQFKYKLTAQSMKNLRSIDDVYTNMEKLVKDNVSGTFRQVPLMAITCVGRGNYGNNYRVRFVPDVNTDKENGYKNYILELLESDGGFRKLDFYSGSLSRDAVYFRESIFLESRVNFKESDLINVQVYHPGLEEVYKKYMTVIASEENKPEFYEFDFLQGLIFNGKGAKLTKFDFEDNSLAVDTPDGIKLVGGSDGCFEIETAEIKKTVTNAQALLQLQSPRDVSEGDIVKTSEGTPKFYRLEDATQITQLSAWREIPATKEKAFNAEYIKLFKGSDGYDTVINSKRRAPSTVMFDAFFHDDVKKELISLAARRNDGRLVLDSGATKTITQVLSWDDAVQLDTDLVTKECVNYEMRDPFTGRPMRVPFTFLWALKFPNHVKQYGLSVPFVGRQYAQLSGFIPGSVYPVIDVDDLDTKEKLYTRQINYVECHGEDIFVRATAMTAKKESSDLSEEANMFVLLQMKRVLEDYVISQLYNLAEVSDRAKFTASAKDALRDFEPIVRDMKVEFAMTPWEEERSILHCYLSVIFKTRFKRAIIEIDINKRV